MGTLRNSLDGTTYVLAARTRVGRSEDNELVLTGESFSASHAVMEWTTSGCWQLRDLGSTNGTFVHGERLASGRSVNLDVGDVISFVDANNAWKLEDDSPPVAEAIHSRTGVRRVAEQGMLLLSSEPEEWLEVVSVDGLWVVETHLGVEAAHDGQRLVSGTDEWTLRLPAATCRTSPSEAAVDSAAPLPHQVSLAFEVSQDLEHLHVTSSTSAGEWSSERAHQWVLLALADVRIREAESGDIHPSEQGWVYSDELCTMAGIDSESRLNVEIHRARKEMASHGVAEPAAIVERRRGTGKLRIGTSLLRIIEGGVERAAPTSSVV